MASFFLVAPHRGTELWNMLGEEERARIAAVGRGDVRFSDGALWNLSATPDPVFRAILRSAFVRFYLDPARLVRALRAHPRPLGLLVPGARSLARAVVRATLGSTASPSPRCL
jgi:hypothetical protein